MAADYASEIEDLQRLEASPGWRRLLDEFKKQDAGFEDLITRIVSTEDDDTQLLQDLRKQTALREYRQLMAEWPRRRIRALEQAENGHAGAKSRRGRL